MEKYKFTVQPIENDVFFTTFGKNTRIEVKNALSIDKFGILIQKFNEQKKQVACVTTYLDSSKALTLANDILSGRLAKIAQAQNGDLKPVFEAQGGKRDGNKVIYRCFKISRGNKWILGNCSGPGKVTATGGFAAAGELTEKVTIGMDDESIKAMALKIKAEYQAYRTAKMIVSLNNVEQIEEVDVMEGLF